MVSYGFCGQRTSLLHPSVILGLAGQETTESTRCPLQVLMGYHIPYVHQDLPSFTLRWTSSYRWACGPRTGHPDPRVHGPHTHLRAGLKDPGQMTWALPEPSSSGLTDQTPSMQVDLGLMPGNLDPTGPPTPGVHRCNTQSHRWVNVKRPVDSGLAKSPSPPWGSQI